MGFGRVVGHRRPVQLLRAMIRRGRIPHALLFVGPEGIGKRTVALSFLQALNCAISPGEGCDRCPSCVKLSRLSHPDLILVSSEGAAVKVDQVREVIRELTMRPLEAQWRGVIVDGAEQMTLEAANAFLKTLEEPPPRTVLILLAQKAEELPPTVLSRCQLLRFSPLRDEEVREVLRRQGMDDPMVAAFAEGSPGRALRMEIDTLRAFRKEVEEFLTAGDVFLALKLAERFSHDREGAKQLLAVLLSFLKEKLWVKVDEGLLDLLWEIQRVRRSLDDNANVRLCLERSFLEVLRYHQPLLYKG